MARIRQSPKLPAAQRREQLIASARKLFVRKGYRTTTTEEIARNAGLSKGALYFHFRNKEDILFALVKDIARRHDEALVKVMTPKMGAGEFFRMLVDLHGECQLPDYSEVVDIWVQAMRIPRLRRYLGRRLHRYADLYVEHVEAPSHIKRSELRELGVLTLALYDGLSVFRLISRSLVDLDRLSRTMERLLKGTGRPGRRSREK